MFSDAVDKEAFIVILPLPEAYLNYDNANK